MVNSTALVKEKRPESPYAKNARDLVAQGKRRVADFRRLLADYQKTLDKKP